MQGLLLAPDKQLFSQTKAISSWGNTYINFKNKDKSFLKIIFKMPFICSRHTIIQTF